MPIEQVLKHIKDETFSMALTLLALTEGRDISRYCRFHQDHRHCTDECRNLKWQIEKDGCGSLYEIWVHTDDSRETERIGGKRNTIPRFAQVK